MMTVDWSTFSDSLGMDRARVVELAERAGIDTSRGIDRDTARRLFALTRHEHDLPRRRGGYVKR